jgi:hypothetical protein
MPIYELTKDSIVAVPTTTFAAEHIRERYDLQRILRDNIGAIAPETYVLAEEYGEWKEAKRRIDLLCLDKKAKLVVVELKRTEDGGHMELQGIRYAAMVSKLTFPDAVRAHSRYLGGEDKEEEAKARILEFLEWDEPREKEFAQDVRLILVSGEFSKEITTSVLWLNERELDIRCVRLRPYSLGDRVLLDIQQVLPLPEAEEYQVQIRKKAAEERQSEGSGADTRYDLTIRGQIFPNLYKRRLFFLVVRALVRDGVPRSEIMSFLASRQFLTVPTKCNTPEDFFEAASRLEDPYESIDDLRKRFYIGADELFHVGGETWALSNQWSKNELPALEKLVVKYPGSQISFNKALRNAPQE